MDTGDNLTRREFVGKIEKATGKRDGRALKRV